MTMSRLEPKHWHWWSVWFWRETRGGWTLKLGPVSICRLRDWCWPLEVCAFNRWSWHE